MEAPRHIQPALIDGKGLHQVGIALIDIVDQAGIAVVFLVMGGEKDQARALFPGLPDGLGGFDAKGLGPFVFGQDDAVAAFGVAANRHGGIL